MTVQRQNRPLWVSGAMTNRRIFMDEPLAIRLQMAKLLIEERRRAAREGEQVPKKSPRFQRIMKALKSLIYVVLALAAVAFGFIVVKELGWWDPIQAWLDRPASNGFALFILMMLLAFMFNGQNALDRQDWDFWKDQQHQIVDLRERLEMVEMKADGARRWIDWVETGKWPNKAGT
jgi:hypothetical protein